MRWLLVLVIAFTSVAAQVNLKVTSPKLPLSLAQAAALGIPQSLWLVVRAGSLSGMTLLLTWYTYKYFGFIELWVASSLSYVVAFAAGYFLFGEMVTWARIGGVVLVGLGVGLFFVK